MKIEEIKRRMAWPSGPRRIMFEYLDYVVPYVRATRGSLWNERSQRYATSKEALGLAAQAAASRNNWKMIEKGQPFRMDITYLTPSRVHGFDMDNLLKAVCDAFNGILFYDDRYMDSGSFMRARGTQHLLVSIRTLGDDER